MTALVDLLKAILTFLRYVAAPLVAVVVVWVADDNHDVIRATMDAFAGLSQTQMFWLAGAFVITLGVTSYYLHRIVVHRIANEIVMSIARHHLKSSITTEDCAFARWERRADTSSGRHAQKALDEMNTSVHFFYSSAVASIVLVVILKAVVPDQFHPKWPLLGVVVLTLGAVALWGDYQAAVFDIRAYEKYSKK